MKTVAPLANIFFYGLALSWILNLEANKECTCSADWRRDFMKWFFMLMVAFQGLILAHSTSITKMIAGPLGIAAFLYIWVTISYVHKLKERDCGCTAGTQRTVLYWLAVIQAALLAWSIFAHWK